MSSDQSGLAVKLVRRDTESCVLTLAGELSSRSTGTVCGAVTKALLEVDRVLIDVSRLRLTWTPAAQVFPSTLAAMGGWPWARLALFGANGGAPGVDAPEGWLAPPRDPELRAPGRSSPSHLHQERPDLLAVSGRPGSPGPPTKRRSE